MKQQNMRVEGKTLVLAVSGGADSVCLLDLCNQLQNELDLKLICVHVNHGLRETALRDEEFVKKLAEERHLPFYVLHADVDKIAKKEKLSEEEAGRRVRYEYLDQVAKEVGADYILLAHHRDDSAETVLFNLFRGTGLRGLGGIRPVQGNYLRPLLGVSRREIEAYLTQRGLEYVTDETNLSEIYSRNRIRHRILPEASQICEAVAVHISDTAEELCAVEEYLEVQTAKAYADCVSQRKDGLHLGENVYRSLPGIIAGRVILAALSMAAGTAKDIGRVHVREVSALFEREAGKRISLPYQMTAHRLYDGILIRKLPEREAVTSKRQSEVNEEVACEMFMSDRFMLNGLGMAYCESVQNPKWENIPQKRYTKWFDYDKMNCCPIFRKRQEGDYLVIDGSGRKKQLNRYLIDEKIPAHERDSLWLLADGSHIMWVVGYRISEAYKVSRSTKQVVQWTITGLQE